MKENNKKHIIVNIVTVIGTLLYYAINYAVSAWGAYIVYLLHVIWINHDILKYITPEKIQTGKLEIALAVTELLLVTYQILCNKYLLKKKIHIILTIVVAVIPFMRCVYMIKTMTNIWS